jgi:hypothetical protein
MKMPGFLFVRPAGRTYLEMKVSAEFPRLTALLVQFQSGRVDVVGILSETVGEVG